MLDATNAVTETGDLVHPNSSLGWKDEGILDLGAIRTASGPENYIVLFFETIGVLKSPFFNIHITR